jgi:hypothetical protein
MIRLDLKAVIHLRLASERGFGPVDLAEVKVGAHFPLNEMREKTRDVTP